MTVYDLWLPILLTGLATHMLSTLAWTLLPHHKPEWNRLPAEDDFQDLIVSRDIPPGQYMMPYCDDAKEMASESFKHKQAKCTGMLVLWKKPINMPLAIVKTLAFFFVAAFVIGYLAAHALPAGAAFGRVVQFVATAGLLTHCAAHFPRVFWFSRQIAMELVDGVVFAMVTGLIFAALWPGA